MILITRTDRISRNKILFLSFLVGIVLLLVGCSQASNTSKICGTVEDIIEEMNALTDVTDVVYANESCMIMFKENANEYSYAFIVKDAHGYYLEEPQNIQKDILFTDAGSATIYHIPGSSDYYLVGMCVSVGSGINICDSLGSKFELICTNDFSTYGIDEKTYVLYSWLNGTPDEYWIQMENIEKQTDIQGRSATQGED